MRRRHWVAAAIASAVAIVAAASARAEAISLVPPHRVIPIRAMLSPALLAAIDRSSQEMGDASADDAVALALKSTTSRLRFGLGHRTHMRFDMAERQAHCAEYAQLFAAVFTRIARNKKLRATARVIRSDARLFGSTIDDPAWRDHDWVLVTAEPDRRWFVDPSFADTGLGWDVQSNVRAHASLPLR